MLATSLSRHASACQKPHYMEEAGFDLVSAAWRRVWGRSCTRLWTSQPTWTCAPTCHHQLCMPGWPRTGSRAASRAGARCLLRRCNRALTPACMSCTLSCATAATCRCAAHALCHDPVRFPAVSSGKLCLSNVLSTEKVHSTVISGSFRIDVASIHATASNIRLLTIHLHTC